MHYLAFVLPLLATVLTQAAPPPVAPDSIAAAQDPCAQARRIVEQRPCVRPGDCGAFREWTETFGAPGPEPLRPEVTGAAAVPAPGPAGATRQPRRRLPPGVNCPADAAAEPPAPDAP